MRAQGMTRTELARRLGLQDLVDVRAVVEIEQAADGVVLVRKRSLTPFLSDTFSVCVKGS
jgi:hypothetical protein